ncbi:RNA chaperone ProQ [Pseudidiomarina taiwanensis]|uniref:RNA chaperone ProQ n=1 Tax=Pseudidiomarina taiwanensis TaxID=337250 RepID=A0A432ZN93_9GAMM|nr:RNA chaperone ProQ [Pseudidiomarina taiwanensis]RUO79350.1 RNA chaperone ProQ [Pseudidiomarina taiwanensis]
MTEDVTKLSTPKEVLAYLAEKFPQCFILDGDAKPLKIGIFEDLAERLSDDPTVSKTRLRMALRHYTSSWRYLRSVVVDAERVNLDGECVAKVEAEHAEHAKEALEESRAKVAERKKQAAAKAPKKTARPAKPKTPKAKPKAKPAAKAKPAPKLSAVSQHELNVGQKVMVKMGQKPMAGEVTAVERNDIYVQLLNGLTVKVTADVIFVTE